ncbi:MAG: SIS domain-containing protein [Clostridia bacterium]|nr:SIS domain-containing protein [Clostridia bacterium]
MEWEVSIKEQIKTLEYAYENMDKKQVEDALKMLLECNGIRFFTGIGKNGHVAAKIASTFSSFGLRSIYIHPVDAVHGDMALFSKGDILVAISKSGSTDELMVFLHALKQINFNNIIGIHSKPESPLDKISRLGLYIPVVSEADHLGIAPVASSLAYMSILQSFAVAISSQNGFTKKDFVRTHPGGALGKLM